MCGPVDSKYSIVKDAPILRMVSLIQKQEDCVQSELRALYYSFIVQKKLCNIFMSPSAHRYRKVYLSLFIIVKTALMVKIPELLPKQAIVLHRGIYIHIVFAPLSLRLVYLFLFLLTLCRPTYSWYGASLLVGTA